MKEVILTLPPVARVPNLIGGMLGTYFGIKAAGRISRTGSRVPGYAVIGLISLQGIATQFVVPQPFWIIELSIVVLLVPVYYGTKAGARL